MQSTWQLIRAYYINNFLVHDVELVYGKRHAVLCPWDTSSFALREIFQDRGHYRFTVDRLFVVHYVLDSLQQRLHSQVMSWTSDQYYTYHLSHISRFFSLLRLTIRLKQVNA